MKGIFLFFPPPPFPFSTERKRALLDGRGRSGFFFFFSSPSLGPNEWFARTHPLLFSPDNAHPLDIKEDRNHGFFPLSRNIVGPILFPSFSPPSHGRKDRITRSFPNFPPLGVRDSFLPFSPPPLLCGWASLFLLSPLSACHPKEKRGRLSPFFGVGMVFFLFFFGAGRGGHPLVFFFPPESIRGSLPPFFEQESFSPVGGGGYDGPFPFFLSSYFVWLNLFSSVTFST